MLFMPFESLDNLIANETLPVSDYGVERLLLLLEVQKKVNVVRHDSISKELMTVVIQNSEKIINVIICVCHLNQREPFVTSKRYEVNARPIDNSVNGHVAI